MAIQIRTKADNAILAQSTDADKAVLVENCWYFSPEQVDIERFTKTDRIYNCPYKGIAYWYDLHTDEGTVQNVAWVYDEPKDGYDHIAGRIGFYNRETSATTAQSVTSDETTTA